MKLRVIILTISAFTFLALLSSCFSDDNINAEHPKLLKTEHYYNGETDELVGLKEYNYDSLGRRVSAHYEDYARDYANKEITWTYDDLNSKTTQVTNYYNQDNNIQTLEFFYEDDKLILEKERTATGIVRSKKQYFYSGDLLDSVQFYYKGNDGLMHYQTEIYIYEDGFLKEIASKRPEMKEGQIFREFSYKDGLLIKECQGSECDYYTYQGTQLTKIETRSEFVENEPVILEEQFFASGHLVKRKLYGFASYDFSDVRNHTNIIYTYKAVD